MTDVEQSYDVISRQAVLDLCDKKTKYDIPYEYYEGKKHIRGWDEGKIINFTKLMQLPSVTPQPKMGHLIDTSGGVECDKCGKWYPHAPIAKNTIKFCCECGAKIVEPQEESEDV